MTEHIEKREYIEKMLRYARKRLREGDYKDEEERNLIVLTIAMFGLALDPPYPWEEAGA